MLRCYERQGSAGRSAWSIGVQDKQQLPSREPRRRRSTAVIRVTSGIHRRDSRLRAAVSYDNRLIETDVGVDDFSS